MNYQTHLGDCLDLLKTLPDNSVDSIVTDPPYGLSFMGRKWDYDVPSTDIWAECLRVLKPGGHLLAFAGTRTQHRMAVRIEDAGFEIRDMIAWVYGCLDEATEVATEHGVVPYHKTKIGDRVLCYDVEHGKYSYQPILEIVEYDYSDTAYRLVGDFGEQVVSRNHRVIVERDGSEAFQLAETLECEARVPVLESLPALRQAIHDAHQGAGRPQQGVRAWGGHRSAVVRVVPFHYTGKVWCLRVPTGAFVAVRNGVAFPTGNSGFPKSLDVSKALDKAAGAEREVVGVAKGAGMSASVPSVGVFRDDAWVPKGPDLPITAPATEAARQWQGWGTALKPALEPITMARKPFKGTVADNVLAQGTGAINIDGCRVGDAVRVNARSGTPGAGRMRSCNLVDRGDGKTPDGRDLQTALDYIARSKEYAAREVQGRWPANLIHDGSGEVSGFLGEQARFFYCAKASKSDRDDGLDNAPQKTAGVGDERPSGSFNERLGKTPTAPRANHHPTVKPTDLMRYLVRLVTPPGGTVLDPFMGSGSTGKAAMLEGFHFVGCEMSPDYMEIAEGRLLAAFLEGVL